MIHGMVIPFKPAVIAARQKGRQDNFSSTTRLWVACDTNRCRHWADFPCTSIAWAKDDLNCNAVLAFLEKLSEVPGIGVPTAFQSPFCLLDTITETGQLVH